MIKLYDRVQIKTNGVVGSVIDISGKGVYTVESEHREIKNGAYPSKWPLYDCHVDDLSLIDDVVEPVIGE